MEYEIIVSDPEEIANLIDLFPGCEITETWSPTNVNIFYKDTESDDYDEFLNYCDDQGIELNLL